MDPRNQSPFNAVPPAVLGLAFVIAAVELMFQAGEAGVLGGREAVGWRSSRSSGGRRRGPGTGSGRTAARA